VRTVRTAETGKSLTVGGINGIFELRAVDRTGLHHRRQAGGLRLVVKALPRWACYDFLLFSMEGKYGHFMLRLYPAGVT
jgi:hypothetical protein